MSNEHQDFERNWWGNCANTYMEETKQIVYASRMGIRAHEADGKYPNFTTPKRVVDIGGGPTSMLLKSSTLEYGAIVDPCDYPDWTVERYRSAGIDVFKHPAEHDLGWSNDFDEAWIYNCLQHVEDPKKIIHNARQYAPVVRIFEWIDIPPHEGHPHMLTAYDLADWLDGHGAGMVEIMDEYGCVGTAFYGKFAGYKPLDS